MKTLLKSFILAVVVVLFACAAPAWAQEEDDLDPLGNVIADMQSAGGRLAKLLTDKPTQQKQLDAVEKLDALIKLLEQRRNRGPGNGNGPPEDPLQDSMIVGGPGGSGPMHAPRRNGNAWGNLPAHKREQILQSMTEGFPAHYQQILERYYRRLAEEKPAGGEATDEGAGATAPATKSKAELAPITPKKS